MGNDEHSNPALSGKQSITGARRREPPPKRLIQPRCYVSNIYFLNSKYIIGLETKTCNNLTDILIHLKSVHQVLAVFLSCMHLYELNLYCYVGRNFEH
jgi:hypothetical protein